MNIVDERNIDPIAEMTRIAQSILSLPERGFNETYRSVKSGELIFDSMMCRISLTWGDGIKLAAIVCIFTTAGYTHQTKVLRCTGKVKNVAAGMILTIYFIFWIDVHLLRPPNSMFLIPLLIPSTKLKLHKIFGTANQNGWQKCR